MTSIAQPGNDAPEGLVLRGRSHARRAVNTVLERAGLVLVPKPPAEALEPAFLGAYERCAPFTMTSRERMYALWHAVRYVVAAGIPGDLVECGVWRGGSTMLAALALDQSRDHERHLWLYDTFEGMAEPGPEDAPGAFGEDPHAEWRKAQDGDHNAWCYSSLDEVRSNLRLTHLAPARFSLVKGKVEDTIPQTLPDRIAVLRLDTDWYESTYHELTHLFPRLESGGVLIIDDYGHWEGARRAVDQYFEEMGVRLLLTRIDDTGRMAVKP